MGSALVRRAESVIGRGRAAAAEMGTAAEARGKGGGGTGVKQMRGEDDVDKCGALRAFGSNGCNGRHEGSYLLLREQCRRGDFAKLDDALNIFCQLTSGNQ
ncbi:hypothetical protein Drorol1_Dr00008422 [Drosera rotundifolia]